MAWDHNARVTPLPAAADLSAKLYFCGVINSSGQLALQTTAGGRVDAIIYDNNASAAGDVVSAGGGGNVYKVKIGGTVTAGNALQADTDGMAIEAATDDYEFAVALESGVDGDIISAWWGVSNIKA